LPNNRFIKRFFFFLSSLKLFYFISHAFGNKNEMKIFIWSAAHIHSEEEEEERKSFFCLLSLSWHSFAVVFSLLLLPGSRTLESSSATAEERI
jgi:hypothetical protein